MSRHGAGGRLVDNLMHFARLLRAAGLPIGPGKVLDALAAVTAVGIARRDDLYWALHAVFVSHPRQRMIFDQAFHVFWRNPKLLERMQRLALPVFRYPSEAAAEPLARRLAEALAGDRSQGAAAPPAAAERRIDAALSWSASARLRSVDFEAMSRAEVEQAKAAVAALRPTLRSMPTRRYKAHHTGSRIDIRATLRSALRGGGAAVAPLRRRRRRRPPPLVVLCDISGSMSGYSRMLLHFAHALGVERSRVHTFVFGTRLTNITRQLRERDADVALARVAQEIADWHGGTRIGECLHTFNRDWSRRVLAQGAVVLLVTDGLDRAAGAGLAREMERLHKSCRRLIWLNPLLRYAEFEPRARGVQAMLPHVDEFRTVHNLQSLADLARALRAGPRRQRAAAFAPGAQRGDAGDREARR